MTTGNAEQGNALSRLPEFERRAFDLLTTVSMSETGTRSDVVWLTYWVTVTMEAKRSEAVLPVPTLANGYDFATRLGVETPFMEILQHLRDAPVPSFATDRATQEPRP